MHHNKPRPGIALAQPETYARDPEKIFPYELLEADARLLYDRALRETVELHHTLTDMLVDGHAQTFTHSVGVGRIASAIASEECDDEDEGVSIVKAALYHDIGKIILPSELLYKKSSLTPSERNLVEYHSIIGYMMAREDMDTEELMAILLHHWFQHNPYPSPLQLEVTLSDAPDHQHAIARGLDIASIVAIADHAEAQHWRSDRPYRHKHTLTPDIFIDHVRQSVEGASRSLGYGRLLEPRLARVLHYAKQADVLNS